MIFIKQNSKIRTTGDRFNGVPLLVAVFVCAALPFVLFAQYGSGTYGSGVYGGGADSAAPTLALVNGVVTPTTDTTPSFTFSSTEAGTISYAGACDSNTSAANAGNNVITLQALNVATYSNCTLTVTDAVGNESSPLTINTFTIQAPDPGDTFTDGDRVRVTGGTVVVYADATRLASNRGVQPNGSRGRAVGVEVDGFGNGRFIRVNFANGWDGFVNINSLQSVSAPTLLDYSALKSQLQLGVGSTTLARNTVTDINGDGIDDREEFRISTLINKVRTDRERLNTLRLQGETAAITAFANVSEADLGNDTNRRYPLGLFDFTAEVEAGGTETVIIYLDAQYDTSNWTYRKFANDSFTDISDSVTYATAVVGGQTVTTITYEIEDNGPLDADDRLGFIADPAGPSEVESSSSGGSSSGSSSGGSSGGSSSRISSSDDADTEDTSDQSSQSTSTPAPGNSQIPNWYRFSSNISAVQPEINAASDVRFLELFLNEYEGENLVVDSVYGPADVAAVQRFQNKYRRQILEIWNLTEATGFVGITTRLKMNAMLNNQVISCPAFTEFNGGRDGVFQSDEVRRTQQILIELDLFAGPATGFWDPWTHEAMVDFQELFHEVMLDPWNITTGTGYKYKTTNKFLNYFVGCETPAVNLEGVGMFDF